MRIKKRSMVFFLLLFTMSGVRPLAATEPQNSNATQEQVQTDSSSAGKTTTKYRFLTDENFNKKSTESSCFVSSIAVDKSEVQSGGSLKLTASYHNTDPVCSAQQLAGQQIRIELGSDLAIDNAEKLQDTDHLMPSVEGNDLVLTFKDLSSLYPSGEGLTSFSGDYSVVINASEVEEATTTTITDINSNDVTINIVPPVCIDNCPDDITYRTDKSIWDDNGYTDVGDYVHYVVTINGLNEHYNNVSGVDIPPVGMSFVSESKSVNPNYGYYILENQNGKWVPSARNFSFKLDEYGQMNFNSNGEVNTAYQIHYYMKVNSLVANNHYLNQVNVNYDTQEDDEHIDILAGQSAHTNQDANGGFVSLSKVNEDKQPLDHVIFGLFDQAGNKIDQLVTDSKGYAVSSEHPAGEYYIQEIKTKDEYLLTDEKYPVKISADGSTSKANGGNAIINYKSGAYISLNKTNSAGNPLANVEFTIYDKTGVECGKMKTDALGNAKSSLLPLGEYTIKETKQLAKYLPNDTIYSINLNENNKIYQLNGGKSIINQLNSGFIDLDKEDNQGNSLMGAEFTVFNSEGRAIDKLLTDNTGYGKSKAIPLGTYTVKETNAPQGFRLNKNTFTVTLSKSGQIVHVNNGNPVIDEFQKGTIKLSKVDEQGKPLSGVLFGIYSTDNDQLISNIETDEQGKGESIKLPLGDYYVQELTTVKGYQLDKHKYPVTLSKDGEITLLNEGKAIINYPKDKNIIPSNNKVIIDDNDSELPYIDDKNVTSEIKQNILTNKKTTPVKAEEKKEISHLTHNKPEQKNFIHQATDKKQSKELVNTSQKLKVVIISAIFLILIILLLVKKFFEK